ncbi:hypothetical protein FS837_002664 [Tulasnella sp. UAMH 9824]|nr:hypothetical protein FS837_002664 [Tulasnella sp. UAMH 9824]
MASNVCLDNSAEHEQAAQDLWDAGGYVGAVLRFRRSKNPSSPTQASRCILDGIRSQVPLATSYGKGSDVLSELFKLSQTALLTPDERIEVSGSTIGFVQQTLIVALQIRFLRSVVDLDSAALKRYGQHFLDELDLRGALLALDAWTQSATLDGMSSMPDDELAEVLLLCQKFGTVIKAIIKIPGFVDLPGIQHVFGLSHASSSLPGCQPRPQDITLQRTIRPCSFVHRLAFAFVDRGDERRSRADPIILPTSTVDDMIRRALLRRLNTVLERVDELARKSRGFELCQQYLINQQCGGRYDGSCWKDHVMNEDLTIERFNSQFRLHILALQMRGSPLWKVSYAVRSQAAQRICRCLALIGQNITGVRPTALGILKGLGTISPLRPEFQRFAKANDWDEVLDALGESTKASVMDELFMIRRDVGYPSIRPRFKTVVCSDAKDILAKLQLTQYPPAIALQSDILCPGRSRESHQTAPSLSEDLKGPSSGSDKQRDGLSYNNAQSRPVDKAPTFESVASTLQRRRSASIIQAFFRRHRRQAGGPIAAAFERLATKLQERTGSYILERALLLCIRGPLPHVLAYLQTLKNLSEGTIQKLNRGLPNINLQNIQELHEKGIEARRIRNTIIRLHKELQPSSNFYFDRILARPVSVVEIVEKVSQVPELIRELRNFGDCPEDLDYELGVEPILSDRVPWSLENTAFPVNARPLPS